MDPGARVLFGEFFQEKRNKGRKTAQEKEAKQGCGLSWTRLPPGPAESPGHQVQRLVILGAKGLASCTLVSQAWAAGRPTSAPRMQQFGF